MIELRILAVIGLLLTMVLVVATMAAILALGRWLGAVAERARGRRVARRTLGEGARMAAHAMTADAERRLRLRQAPWRLRC